MEEIKEKIIDELLGVIRETLPAGRQVGDIREVEVNLKHPAQEEHGDFSTNVALALFEKIQGYSSPIELADEIVKRLIEHSAKNKVHRKFWDSIEKIEAVKPGFINFHLSPKVFSKQLQLALELGERYGDKGNKGAGVGMGTMILDHSHPNIAKRFGIGHLRSTIIGEALVNIYRFLGWKVISDNFLGDWGTQFGALLAQIQNSKFKIQKSEEKIDLSVDDLEKMYVEFNTKAKEKPELWEEARTWFKKLEDNDPIARSLWEQIKSISMVEFERIWDLLGVKFDYIHPESFFEDKMQAVLDDAKKKNLSKTSQGALVVEIPGRKVPLMLLKSDGATTYETRDLAAIKFWKKEFRPDVIAYEVGSEQAQHFENVFAVSEMLGYMPKEKLVHIQHGLYLSSEGKKMRTRTGGTIKLEEVLDEAVKRAKKLGEMRVIGPSRPVSSRAEAEEIGGVERENIAKIVGIGAIKYFDLSHHPRTDIVFDWESIFQLEGNSAPYLQYTYARCRSVIGKVRDSDNQMSDSRITDNQISEDLKTGNLKSDNLNSEELAILRHFYKFGEVVELAAKTYSPNLVCSFLFELAQRFNTFYAKHKILEDQLISESGNQEQINLINQLTSSTQTLRLALTQVTANILKTGLNLLGIEAPERM